MASGHWNHHGSGSSQLCMPLEEAHETNLPQTTKVLAELYRTEYRSSGALAEFTAQDVDNKEVPCAVCATPGHATLMVPAWHECPTGWTEQYDGWLMAEKQSSLHTSEWICVDHQPQALNNSDPAAQTDSNTLYAAELRAPPRNTYTQFYEVACAVCTKDVGPAKHTHLTTFVHWGRSHCPGMPEAETLYDGWAGGARYDLRGTRGRGGLT